MTILNRRMNNCRRAAVGLIIMIAVVSVLIVSGGDAYAESTLKRKDKVWFGGETWIVLDVDRVANYKTNYKGILLLSEYILEESRMYDTSEPQGSWDGSIIQIYLKDLFEKQLNMTETEKKSVLTAEKEKGETLMDEGLYGERFFLLNYNEFIQVVNGNPLSPTIADDDMDSKACWTPRRGGGGTTWWLRGNQGNTGLIVTSGIQSCPNTVTIGKYQTHGIRPAFYLNPEAVESVELGDDGIYVITFKDGSKSTDDAIGAMVPGDRELKRWCNSQDARWLYFGATNKEGNPAKWRVIGYDGSGTHNTPKGVVSLFANSFNFNYFGNNNKYCESAVKSYFDGLVSKLPEGELDAIKKRTLLTEDYTNIFKRVDGVAGNKVENAVYWPLSCYEADAVMDAIKRDDTQSCSWLRSPAIYNNIAYIMENSYLDTIGVYQDEKDVTPDKYAGYRPVCWLMTDKILLTSPAVGGKNSGQLGPDALKTVTSTTTNEWKATIADKAHENFTVKSLESLLCDGSEAVLSYSGAVTGVNEYISAIIIDKFDNIRYYGRFKNCTSANDSSGKIHVRLDDRMKEGDRIYFFNEQLNGDKRTDFASVPKEVAITSGHDYDFNGFEWVGNDQNGYTEVYAKYKCSNTKCGAETKIKAALDAKVTDPTCLDKGKTEYDAKIVWADSLDGKEHTQSYTAEKSPLGHSFTNYVSNNDATCTNDGTKTAKCDRCDETDTISDVGSAKGHQWIAATCTKPKECSVCHTTEGSPAGHKWKFDGFEWDGNDNDGYTSAEAKYICENDPDHKDTVSKVTISVNEIKPTCLAGGKTIYTAIIVNTDSLDFTEHSDFKEAKAVGLSDHSWKAATCTEPKTCSVCHTTEGEPLGHTWDDGIVSKEPTAAEYGEKTFTCTVCKAVRTETIPMLKPDEKEAEEAKEDEDLPVIDIEKADTMGNFKKKQVKIVFPADSKVDNYRVQYRIAGKKNWTSDWSAGTGVYTVKNLKKGSLLEFRIAGYVKLENGTWIRSKWSKTSYRYMSSSPLKTVKAGKKSIKVIWTKDSKSDGYRIQYSLKKNMKGKRAITVKGKSKTKYTIKGLKKGKTYYVRIRPIKIKSGKTYIGILSGTKKAKVK